MENEIEVKRTLDNLPGSGVAYCIINEVKSLVPLMKKRTEAYLTDKEMKHRKVKDA